jgi:alpha-tubulin suppressor-like RCC1 family protein
MRVLRTLGALALALAALIGAPAAAQAASGPWLQVSAGWRHTCAINTGHSLYCWGRNENGQVGDGNTDTPHLGLHRVGAAGAWSSVSAGTYHTCGITTAKNLYCWGNNEYGEVGDGDTDSPHLGLYRVGAAGVWSTVSTGSYHTCGITTAKNLYCWGRNENGEVGDGNTDNPHLGLYRVGAAGVWSTVNAGAYHTCGITTAKNLYCWGYNGHGEVGDGNTDNPHLGLYRVGAAGVWASVTAGYGHTCGITTAKNLYCWGYNDDAEVGDGTQITPRLGLYRVGAAGVWSTVNAGDYHTCGITTAKNFYCWGNNGSGQVGDGNTDNPHLGLYRVGAAGVWASANPGGFHTCGITSAENLYCWGYNADGQVGDGTNDTPHLGLYRVS